MPDPIAFNERRVQNIEAPASGRVTYHDAASPLLLRVTSAGAKSWYIIRRINGKSRRVRLGTFPAMSVAGARKLAHVEVGRINAGVDPVAERKHKRQQATAKAYTVEACIEDYIADAEKGVRLDKRGRMLKPGTLKGYRDKAELLDALKRLPVANLDAGHIDALKRKHKTSQAAHAIKLLRAACNYAAGRGLLATNVFANRRGDAVALPPKRSHIPARDFGRFLLAIEQIHDEAKEKGKAEPDDEQDAYATVGEQIAADALLLMAIYGLRRNEALTLPVADVDLKHGEFHVRDTKNRDPLTLPVTKLARPVLDRRLKLARRLRSRFVFPTITNHKSAAGHLTEPRPAMRRITKATEIDFTCHDLRRTFASLAAKRLPHAMLKAAMNHRAERKGDITLDYVQVTVDDLRQPLEALHAHMTTLRDAEKAKAKQPSRRKPADASKRAGQG